MKRVLIIALASIFLVNMLAIIPKAELIYDNGTLSAQSTTNENGITSCSISGDYVIEADTEYKIELKLPKVNGEIPNNFELNAGAQSNLIVINNDEITHREEIKNLVYENESLRFTYKGKKIDHSITRRFRYYFNGYEPNIAVTITIDGNPLKIETVEPPSAGDIMIEYVSNAPKDVLRDIVSILPVVLTVCIAYITTRKGISFIRFILESA